MSGLRNDFLTWLTAQYGSPYVWGAKGTFTVGQQPSTIAFDCSGLVTCGFHAMGLPDWRQTHNTQRLWDELEPTDNAAPGDLAFYGPPDTVDHVMAAWADSRVYGACGGNRDTTTPEIAMKQFARVRFRPTVKYRPDFRGYRKSPFKGE